MQCIDNHETNHEVAALALELERRVDDLAQANTDMISPSASDNAKNAQPAVGRQREGRCYVGCVFLFSPRMFINARQNCRRMSAYACTCTPRMTHRALLNRNSPNPIFRRRLRPEDTNHEAITVAAMAGH